MTADSIIDLAYTIMKTAFWITLPVLAISMAIGIVVAVFQAATQIQEASLNFVPKLIGMGIAVIFFGPWILEKLSGFTIALITSVTTVGK
jgi:flagellar biosynthetic protein FliQ